MTHVFTFTSSQFDEAGERPNPINPIAGESVLKWLRTRLDPRRFTMGEPDAEDWGWYADVQSGERVYLLGASGEWGEPGTPVEWTVQLHVNRSVRDKLFGANKLAPDDPLSVAIEAVLKGTPECRNVDVDRNA